MTDHSPQATRPATSVLGGRSLRQKGEIAPGLQTAREWHTDKPFGCSAVDDTVLGFNPKTISGFVSPVPDGGERPRDRLPCRRPRRTLASAGREGARRARVTPWRRR